MTHCWKEPAGAPDPAEMGCAATGPVAAAAGEAGAADRGRRRDRGRPVGGGQSLRGRRRRYAQALPYGDQAGVSPDDGPVGLVQPGPLDSVPDGDSAEGITSAHDDFCRRPGRCFAVNRCLGEHCWVDHRTVLSWPRAGSVSSTVQPRLGVCHPAPISVRFVRGRTYSRVPFTPNYLPVYRRFARPGPVISVSRFSGLERAQTARNPLPRGSIPNTFRRSIIPGLLPDGLKGDSRHSTAKFRATRLRRAPDVTVSSVTPVPPRSWFTHIPALAGPATGGSGRPFRSNAASSAILMRCPRQLSRCPPQIRCRQRCSKIM